MEKDLSPITVELFLLTSRTGAKLISMPAAINSVEASHPISLKIEELLFFLTKLDISCIDGILVNSVSNL